jgi:hypothetical protein
MNVAGRKGKNTVLMKVTNGAVAWVFGARVTDMKDEPIDLNQK